MKSPEDQLQKNLSQNAEATFYKGFKSKHDLRSILTCRTCNSVNKKKQAQLAFLMVASRKHNGKFPIIEVKKGSRK